MSANPLAKSKPLIVGLTGGIACGKSTVANLFKELGASLIDADEITRELTKTDTPIYKEIKMYFGSKSANEDQTLNRKYLRERIFKNRDEKIWLESLLHPLVFQHILDFTKATHSDYVIAVVPLLFEHPIPKWIDKTITISCAPEIQFKRLLGRDHISETLAKQIIESQLPDSEKCKRADFIIQNNGDLENLREQVLKLHHVFLDLTKQSR